MPVSCRVGCGLGEGVMGMTARRELDRHIRDDVPALPQVAGCTRAATGAVHGAIHFEEPMMRLEDALFGLVPSLRREGGIDSEQRCQPGVILASHASVGCG